MSLRPAFFTFATLLAIVQLFAAPPALAADAVILSAQQMSIDNAIDYVEDATHQLKLGDVMKPDVAWQTNSARTFNKGYNNSAWWLRVRIRNAREYDTKQLLEVGYALLDHLDIYVIADDVTLQTYNLGDKLPYRSRPIDNRFYVVPLQFESQQTLTLYLRVQSAGTVQAPLMLWDYGEFFESDSSSTLLQGIYYGGLVVIAAYNLLIYFVLRERSYIYYVGFVLSIPMLMAAMSGQAYHYLWPTATRWNDIAVVVFMATSTVFGLLFAVRFLRLGALSRQFTRCLQLLMLLAAGNGLMSFVLPYHVSIQVGLALTMTVTVAGIAAGIYAHRKGQTSARMYLIAWSTFLLGAFVLAANKMALLPSNLFTEYAAQTGSMIEAVLLSFALAQRINYERRLRFEAQDQALQTSRHMNQELEQRVSQRTQELQLLNQRLQQLSDTDQLTQLKNRRALEACLAQEWARAARYGHSLAVVMVDIDHFKSINDRHGHPAGDSCLRQVAQLIASGVRWPGDTTSRYGGEEFCLILPETGVEEAQQLLETLRERIAATDIEAAAANFRITISAGLYVAVPHQSLPAEAFIRAADVALYQSKQAGRNRVTVNNA